MTEEDKKLKALRSMIKEEAEKLTKDEKTALEAKWAEQEETNAKILEENKELKASLETMQGKIITMSTKTSGVQQYLFNGYNPNMIKNFKSTLNDEECAKVAEVILKAAKMHRIGEIDFQAAFDGDNAIPVQYGSAVMGLAELSSRALTYARVLPIEAPTFNMPVKGTRDTVDAQASGTANTAGTSTIGKVTFTIDKRVGNYIELYNDDLEDANVNLVNEIIVPFQGEAVGQNADDEMFNGTEFTSSISDVTATVDSTSITYSNLVNMYYGIEWERMLPTADPKWFGPRSALATISKLTDDQGRPIFQQVPINGRPSQTLMGAEYVITPAISTAPAAGSLRLAFGDPSQYMICVRGGTFTSMVNPYIKMKEDVTQFICKARMDGNIIDNATAASSTAWATMIESA